MVSDTQLPVDSLDLFYVSRKDPKTQIFYIALQENVWRVWEKQLSRRVTPKQCQVR
jgi:hypothetical protein